MKSIKTLLIMLLASAGMTAEAAGGIGIIPAPASATVNDGTFSLSKHTVIFHDGSGTANAAALRRGIEERFGLNLKAVEYKGKAPARKAIVLRKADSMAAEQYSLSITPELVECRATTDAGMFYAVQSLLQLFDSNGKTISAPCCTIDDSPLYSWRGFMLDEARHFHGKEAVMQYLDIMAGLKMNRFHWHLTDMEGWRIEIKKYPKLTEVGGIGNLTDPKAPAAFYTQDEIREIVKYAAERHITIVPEIDMPGHATAATKAYPEISGGGKGRWDGFTFNPASETTYAFIRDVMTEVASLFPGDYIHIGADEVHYGNQSWFTDPAIQKFIRDNYLMSEAGLEQYFIRRACQIVNDCGKKMIGWDEIVNSGVTPDRAIVMWWRQERTDALAAALSKGFEVIMNPRLTAYLDFLQDETHKTGRRWWQKREINTIDKVYAFPEMYSNLVGKRGKQVLGVQSIFFSETANNKTRLDFMVFPRLVAMAENGWTQTGNKDYEDFMNRLKKYLKYLDLRGIKYYNPFDSASTPEVPGPAKKADNPIANG